MSSTFNRPMLLWSAPGTSELSSHRLVKDATWATSYTYSAKDSTRISVKAGNKSYVLSSTSQSASGNGRKAGVSEKFLFEKYR